MKKLGIDELSQIANLIEEFCEYFVLTKKESRVLTGLIDQYAEGILTSYQTFSLVAEQVHKPSFKFHLKHDFDIGLLAEIEDICGEHDDESE